MACQIYAIEIVGACSQRRVVDADALNTAFDPPFPPNGNQPDPAFSA
jgi:hypothetical protein